MRYSIVWINDCIEPKHIIQIYLDGENGNWDYGDETVVLYLNTVGKQDINQQNNYELNILCEVGMSFNVSQNPILKENNDVDSPILKSFVTGSDLEIISQQSDYIIKW